MRGRPGLWSPVTQNFAYFVVWKKEEVIGVAYCCEFTIEGGYDSGDGFMVSGVTWEGNVFDGRS